jgi:hypothetical protein
LSPGGEFRGRGACLFFTTPSPDRGLVRGRSCLLFFPASTQISHSASVTFSSFHWACRGHSQLLSYPYSRNPSVPFARFTSLTGAAHPGCPSIQPCRPWEDIAHVFSCLLHPQNKEQRLRWTQLRCSNLDLEHILQDVQLSTGKRPGPKTPATWKHFSTSPPQHLSLAQTLVPIAPLR